MEFNLVFVSWIVCIILFMLWDKEKKRRISEVESAMIQAKEIEHHAFEECRKTRLDAEYRIRKAEERNAIIIQEAELRVAQAMAKCQNEIDAIKATSHKELATMRTKAEERIREERESICDNKETLRTLSEKELAIECMTALNTYAHRLDRLENRMSNMAISLDGVLKKTSKEKKPYTHVGIISDSELISIVQEATKRVERITEWTVQEGIIRGLVISQHKLSTWSFTIDFNDDGELTGNYTVFSENDASTIPQRLAKDIAKEIVYRLNHK